MNAFIRNNYYPSNEEINAAISNINARLSLFETYVSKPGSYFNCTEMNYCFEMIYKDIEILYKVLQDILTKEYSELKVHIESTLSELESKADKFSKKCREESNATTLGTTILFQSNSWNITTKDQITIIDLGDHDFIEGSEIACFANINDIEKEMVAFKFENADSSITALPYNLYDNITYRIPGELGINKHLITLSSAAVVNDYLNIDYETDMNNDYKMLGAKGFMSVTGKASGITNIYPCPSKDNYSYVATEDCFIEFYVVDGNTNDSNFIEYNFNMAPVHQNFSLQNGTIKIDSDIKRIYIEAQAGLAMSFYLEQGDIYAECIDAIISDKNTLLYNGNLHIRDIMLREYVKSNKVKYNVQVYINTIESIVDNIDSIYVKEI
jgi:hypothetical protein